MSNCLQLDHVDYAYGAAKILVLSDVSADFESGKMYAITGPSGAGKSTLLSLLAGLDAPSRGVVRFEGEDIAASGYAKHRREHVSLVFQDHNLIDYLTPEENLRLVSTKADMKILEELGLSREESKRNIMHLSGGQRQRVAVGRALVAPGRAILADEPTGSLDPEMLWNSSDNEGIGGASTLATRQIGSAGGPAGRRPGAYAIHLRRVFRRTGGLRHTGDAPENRLASSA